MSSLILRFASPLQSWGGYRLSLNKDSVAPTSPLPRKSAVSGLIGAAIGSRDLAEIASSYALFVRSDKPGSVVEDYQVLSPLPSGAATDVANRWIRLETAGTVKAIPGKRAAGSFGTSISRKDYLAHAEFLVAIESVHAATWAEAFAASRFMLSLGRMSCPPSFPFIFGVWHDEPLRALSSIPALGRAGDGEEAVLSVGAVSGNYSSHEVESSSVRVPTVGSRREQLNWVKENLQ